MYMQLHTFTHKYIHASLPARRGANVLKTKTFAQTVYWRMLSHNLKRQSMHMWCLVPVQPIANLVGPLDLGLDVLALVIVLRIFHCKIFMNLYEWFENSLWRTRWRAFFMWIRLMQFRFFVRICTGWCFTLSSISLGRVSSLPNGGQKTVYCWGSYSLQGVASSGRSGANFGPIHFSSTCLLPVTSGPSGFHLENKL